MGLRAWPEKKRIYKKRPPERQKGLKRAKTKEQETKNKGPPMKKCQKPSALSRKLRQNIGAPDFGA